MSCVTTNAETINQELQGIVGLLKTFEEWFKQIVNAEQLKEKLKWVSEFIFWKKKKKKKLKTKDEHAACTHKWARVDGRKATSPKHFWQGKCKAD